MRENPRELPSLRWAALKPPTPQLKAKVVLTAMADRSESIFLPIKVRLMLPEVEISVRIIVRPRPYLLETYPSAPLKIPSALSLEMVPLALGFLRTRMAG